MEAAGEEQSEVTERALAKLTRASCYRREARANRYIEELNIRGAGGRRVLSGGGGGFGKGVDCGRGTAVARTQVNLGWSRGNHVF